ncbi:MAG: hypothetical protein CFE62_006475 [Candidatus Aquirickettsiella gammari]|jgi:cytolethal distending toxin subunit A|uniref:Uncharacterized protein n=1 Tax=Candidatus Aquirickettsiella gammari TaxID=2016198 RepID=A0A370CFK0_9COXI|nr:MAG: hypothetical protein CFE62_006475 [Candidatus Aquirickettsiella gammari]
MQSLKILKIIIFIYISLLSLDTMSSEIGPEISLYNIGTGYLPYIYHNGSNEYLGFDYAYELRGSDYPQRASWNIVYNANGTISFRNSYKNVCIQWYYGDGYRTIQQRCNTVDARQQFNLQLTTTGALLIKSQKNGQCLYSNGNLYNGTCQPKNLDYFWALIPPLKKSST